ncbi:MAG: SRPBCC domain-containing protein [Pseudomonadota bacterium]
MIDPAGLLNQTMVERPAEDARRITRVFTVQPGVLWRLFTDAKHFSGWWGSQGATCTRCELDLRVGGAWRTEVTGDDSGQVYIIGGAYLAIEPPHRLVFTWRFGDPPNASPTSEVTLDFAARGRGSELRLHHRSLPPDMAASHEAGWLSAIESLVEHISAEGL